VLVLAYPVSHWLSARISRPINDLVELMDRVAREGAYSTRAQGRGPEEVCRLGGAFNHMLEQIEAREQALERNKFELESRIAERTAELQTKQAELEILARTDGLTGLNNRRHFMEQVGHEFRRTQRQERPLSIVMIDLDHFKQVNDTYGHQVGDRVLAGVARVLRDTIRATDLVGRFGGEEFVLALPETDAADAHDLAKRLCQAVREWAYEPASELPILHTSCSLGVATWWPGSADSLEEILRRADTALYRAKEQGRNRVMQA
jgi:diguanylate cyclase